MNSQSKLNLLLQEFVAELPMSAALCVAYSGGVDSRVLLEQLHKLQLTYDFTLRAVHVNHQLQAETGAWQAHCQIVCDELGVELETIQVSVNKGDGDSLEAAARHARYAAFESILQTNEILCTGHHLDDQIETFMLQLLRGAGLAGLAAMPGLKTFANGMLARPMLALSRAEIIAYAKRMQLTWVDDPSNHHQAHARNYLRHAVLPLVAENWPSYQTTMARSIEHCQSGAQLLVAYGAEDLTSCLDETGYLQITPLRQYGQTRQFNILRCWFKRLKVLPPSQIVMQRIYDELIMAKVDSRGLVAWGKYCLSRFQDKLYLLHYPLPAKQSYNFTPSLGATLAMTGEGCLAMEKITGKGIALKCLLNAKSVSIRNRSGGEKIALYNNSHRRSLKNLWQQWQIPPWWRDHMPLVYIDDELVAVAQYAVAESFQAHADEVGIVFTWHSQQEVTWPV